MQLRYQPFTLQLKNPFKIAAGTRTSTSIVLVELYHNEEIGYGEASLPPYLPESENTVMTFFQKLNFNGFTSPLAQLNEIQAYIQSVEAGNYAAKAAVDIALYDLAGKLGHKSVGRLLNIKQVKPVDTSLTISISSAGEVIRQFNEAVQFNILKVKLGSENDGDVIAALVEKADKPFGIDVNQGWKYPEQAVRWMKMLENTSCQYVEQPFAVEQHEATRFLRKNVNLPIIADEAIQTYADIDEVSNHYDGINVKLMKCGGLKAAKTMIDMARKKDMKVVLGSMTETSCALTAAAHLSPLADWTDLDSQFLTANDPFTGMNVEDGKVVTDRTANGLGVKKKSPA